MSSEGLWLWFQIPSMWWFYIWFKSQISFRKLYQIRNTLIFCACSLLLSLDSFEYAAAGHSYEIEKHFQSHLSESSDGVEKVVEQNEEREINSFN